MQKASLPRNRVKELLGKGLSFRAGLSGPGEGGRQPSRLCFIFQVWGRGKKDVSTLLCFTFFSPACETDFCILKSCVMTSPVNDSQ